jgi:hypothetical protein
MMTLFYLYLTISIFVAIELYTKPWSAERHPPRWRRVVLAFMWPMQYVSDLADRLMIL